MKRRTEQMKLSGISLTRPFTTREKVMIAILAVIILALGYYKLFYEPVQDDISSYESEQLEYETLIAAQGASVARLNSLRAAVEQYEAEGVEPIPSFDNLSPLMVQLSSVLDSRTTEYSLSFASTTSSDYVVLRPISISFTARSYSAACGVIEALSEGYPCIITNVSVSTAEDGTASSTLEVYYYEIME